MEFCNKGPRPQWGGEFLVFRELLAYQRLGLGAGFGFGCGFLMVGGFRMSGNLPMLVDIWEFDAESCFGGFDRGGKRQIGLIPETFAFLDVASLPGFL